MKFTTTLLLALVIIFSACNSTKNVSQPEFRDIGDVTLMETGLLTTKVGANMIYYNPNNFGIHLNSARGDVYLDNMYFGTFDLVEGVQVKKRSEFVLPVMLKIDNINALKNNIDIFKKKEALVRIEGHALVSKSGFSKDIPIRFEQVQNLDQLRAIVTR